MFLNILSASVFSLHDDGLGLFESGAILLHLGERCAHHNAPLLPVDANERARVTMWMFAALN
jgi:glutathione S-transferase